MHLLYYTSHITIFSILYAAYCRLYLCGFINVTVLATSLLYWSDPTNPWKRRLDQRIVTISGLWYILQAWKNLSSPQYLTFSILSITAIYFYFLARFASQPVSAYLHAMLHVFANSAVIYFCYFN